MYDEFSDLIAAELADRGSEVSPRSVAACAAALESGSHVLLNGGTRSQRAALAEAIGAAATSGDLANGTVRVRVGRWPAQNVLWGASLAADATAARLWVVVDDIDLWPFATTELANALLGARPGLRAVLTASGRRRQPTEGAWASHRRGVAWIEVDG